MDNTLNFGGQPSPHVQPRQTSAATLAAYAQHTTCPYMARQAQQAQQVQQAQQAQQAQQMSFSTNQPSTSGGQMYNVYGSQRSATGDMMPMGQPLYSGMTAAPILPAPYQPYQQSLQQRGHYFGNGYPAYSHRPNGMYQVMQPGTPQSWIQTQPNSTLFNETPGSSFSPSQAIPGQAQNSVGRYSYNTYSTAYTGSSAAVPGQTPTNVAMAANAANATNAPASITPAQPPSAPAPVFALPAQPTTSDQGPNQASLADSGWSANFIVAQQGQQMHHHQQQQQEILRLEREQMLSQEQSYQAQLATRYRQIERAQTEQQSRLSAWRRQAAELQGSVARASSRIHPWGPSPALGVSRAQRHAATNTATATATTQQDSLHRQGPDRRLTGAGVLNAHEMHSLALGSLRVRRHDAGAASPHAPRRAGRMSPSNPLGLTPGALAMTARALMDERTRAAQLLRGAIITQRVASKSAIASLESVDIESLSEDKKMCVICYNDFGVANPEGINEAPLRLPKCKHVFGDHCIKKWFSQSDSCPYCRDKLPSQTVSRTSTNTRAMEQYVHASEQLRALHSDYQIELQAMMDDAGMPYSPSPSPSLSPEPALSPLASLEPVSPVDPSSADADADADAIANVNTDTDTAPAPPQPSPRPANAELSTAVPSPAPENGGSSIPHAASPSPLSPMGSSSTNARRGPSEVLEDDRRRRRRNSATHPSTLTLRTPTTSDLSSDITLAPPPTQDQLQPAQQAQQAQQDQQDQQPQQPQQSLQPQQPSVLGANSFLETPYSFFTNRAGLGQGSSINGNMSMYQVSSTPATVLPSPLQLGQTYQPHEIYGAINNHDNLP